MLTFHRRKLSFNITNGTVKYCTEKKFKTDFFLNTVVTTPLVLTQETFCRASIFTNDWSGPLFLSQFARLAFLVKREKTSTIENMQFFFSRAKISKENY